MLLIYRPKEEQTKRSAALPKEELEKPTKRSATASSPYEVQTSVTQSLPSRQRTKEIKNVAIKVEECVICPFCSGQLWTIGDTFVECLDCGVQFNKDFIKSDNIHLINMNLRFLVDSYKNGVPERYLGIKVPTPFDIDDS